MRILNKLHWFVMETSFLVHNAYFWVQLANGDANLGITSCAHRYGNYTENVIFNVLLVFFLSGIYDDQKEKL